MELTKILGLRFLVKLYGTYENDSEKGAWY